MKTGDSYTNQRFRFTKWSRNAYAAFASIGKEVSIGRLSVSAAQWVGDALNQLSTELVQLLRIALDEDVDVESESEITELMPLMVSIDTECEIRNIN